MTIEAKYVKGSDRWDYTPSTAKDSGEIIELADGRAGVVTSELAAGELGVLATEGQWDLAKASATVFAAGDAVWWDVSASLAITALGASDDVYVGVAVAAAGSGATRVRVDLNVRPPSAPYALLGTAWASLDHADTEEHELVSAGSNATGLVICSAIGVITEACAGGTEDQLIVTIYDSDDNDLSVLTVTDGGADALGDAIVGTLTEFAGSTGGALAVIPAGKGCYAKVSQATTGTSAAGAMDVSLVVRPAAPAA